jgi:hypothetical protein
MSDKTRKDDHIDDEDVDDVIEIASEIAERENKEKARMSVDDVVDIGEQLGLEADDVEEAVGTLRDREARDAARAARRKKWIRYAGGAAAALAVSLMFMGLIGRGRLNSARDDVDKARAQVRNVIERQANVEARLADQPASRDKDAELAGAENRIAIEKRRYDEAASKYNGTARSFTGAWGARFFAIDKRVPLSNEVETW